MLRTISRYFVIKALWPLLTPRTARGRSASVFLFVFGIYQKMGSKNFRRLRRRFFTITSCSKHDFPSKIGAAGEIFYDFCTCFTDFTVFESNFSKILVCISNSIYQKTVSSESVYQILVYILYTKKNRGMGSIVKVTYLCHDFGVKR